MEENKKQKRRSRWITIAIILVIVVWAIISALWTMWQYDSDEFGFFFVFSLVCIIGAIAWLCTKNK